jgi:hypothetical protein
VTFATTATARACSACTTPCHVALRPLLVLFFFYEINRDQKGFNTGDGAIVVGGFFRAQIRESTDAKVPFGTFPKVHFPPENRKLDKVKVFMKKCGITT